MFSIRERRSEFNVRLGLGLGLCQHWDPLPQHDLNYDAPLLAPLPITAREACLASKACLQLLTTHGMGRAI